MERTPAPDGPLLAAMLTELAQRLGALEARLERLERRADAAGEPATDAPAAPSLAGAAARERAALEALQGWLGDGERDATS